MATLNGTNLIVSLAGTAIAMSKECDLDITNAARDITTKSSAGWKESAADGMRAWKVTGKGLADFGASGNFTTLFFFFFSRATVTLQFGASGTGNKYYTGSAILKSLKGSGPLEETAPFDFEFEGTAALTEAAHT
jgi:predicted secreted protein